MAAPVISLYNTLTRRDEPLEPQEPGHVRMYVCGVTVYDYAHIGHARVIVVFDALVRFLEWRGLKVTFVRNLTDVDDKIIDRAKATGTTAAELGTRMGDAFIEDAMALGCRQPDVEPRATQHIPEMLALIEKLEQGGHAYRSSGDVYFDVPSYPAYGRLSNRKLDDLVAGARVEVTEVKRNPADFALWKGVKPGEPSWESPFGPGRPGWHIECSAMSSKYLGQPFDLHGGGEDLIFPHHENEVAQSEAAYGTLFSKHWMHVSFLRLGAEKMSKSLGNFVTIRQALEKYPAEAIRLFLLQTQYRSPLEFSEAGFEEAQGTLVRMYETLVRAGIVGAAEPGAWRSKAGANASSQEAAAGAASASDAAATLLAEFRAALASDLNTPAAVATLHDAVRSINKLLNDGQTEAARGAALALREVGSVLGVLQADPAATLESWRDARAAAAGLDEVQIQSLIDDRNAARKAKDWKKADAIRDQLAEAGIDLKDRPDGTTGWSARR